MLLTSQIKELGAILQKLIKFEPGNNSRSTNETKWDGVVGDADALGPGVFGFGLGAVTETNEKSETIGSHKN